MHVAPACAGSNHFESYVCSLILHFYQRLFSELEVLNHDLIAIIWQILRQEFIALQTKIPSSPGTVTLVCTMIALKAGWAASLPRLVIQAAMATWALCFMDYSSLKCTTFMPLDMSDDFKSTTEEKKHDQKQNFSARHSDKQATWSYGDHEQPEQKHMLRTSDGGRRVETISLVFPKVNLPPSQY
jgi:hypothetical protein